MELTASITRYATVTIQERHPSHHSKRSTSSFPRRPTKASDSPISALLKEMWPIVTLVLLLHFYFSQCCKGRGTFLNVSCPNQRSSQNLIWFPLSIWKRSRAKNWSLTYIRPGQNCEAPRSFHYLIKGFVLYILSSYNLLANTIFIQELM